MRGTAAQIKQHVSCCNEDKQNLSYCEGAAIAAGRKNAAVWVGARACGACVDHSRVHTARGDDLDALKRLRLAPMHLDSRKERHANNRRSRRNRIRRRREQRLRLGPEGCGARGVGHADFALPLPQG